MKTTYDLDKEDLGYLQDQLLSAGYDNSEESARYLFDCLQQHLKGLAVSWGCGDTPFRDSVHVFLREDLKTKAHFLALMANEVSIPLIVPQPIIDADTSGCTPGGSGVMYQSSVKILLKPLPKA